MPQLQPKSNLKIKLIASLAQIDKSAWQNLLPDDNPFYQYDFLYFLEKYQCIGKHFGWITRHLLAFNGDELVGGLMLYEKHNNYGEFVFDYAWANAYSKHQLLYYPKLVSAIPYTPITCAKLLSKYPNDSQIKLTLLNAAKQLSEQLNFSSLHLLFSPKSEHDFLAKNQMLSRQDIQFHWSNQNYQTFEDFLAKLKPKKRKNIRQERKKIKQSSIAIRQLDGNSATLEDWKNFAQFYQQTFLEKSGTPTLNLDFFKAIAHSIPQQILLILADDTITNTCIAGSLMFASSTTLYGRHWGCIEPVDYLHFELCYYQGIEYCIKQGLQTFEPGAQGEYKIARGFLPTQTQSSHYLTHDYFYEPIKDFCQQEAHAVKQYGNNLNSKNPYQL